MVMLRTSNCPKWDRASETTTQRNVGKIEIDRQHRMDKVASVESRCADPNASSCIDRRTVRNRITGSAVRAPHPSGMARIGATMRFLATWSGTALAHRLFQPFRLGNFLVKGAHPELVSWPIDKG